MEEALQRSQGGDLKVSVLLDYSRGSRGSSLPPAALPACRLRRPPHPDSPLSGLPPLQDGSTPGRCCCRCCAASPRRCESPCTTRRTCGGCCACSSRSASTRPSASSTSRSTCSTTASSSAGASVFLHASHTQSIMGKTRNEKITFAVCELKKQKQPTQTTEQNPTNMETSIFSSFDFYERSFHC